MAYVIRAPKGANKKKKIIGRGNASKGNTSGRGNNGQNARSGGGVRPGFEGGQMPLYRRVARRGFSNYPFKKIYAVISLDTISSNYEDGEIVNNETLRAKGILKGKKEYVKILGSDQFSKKLTFEIDKISASARTKIVAAGGTVPEISQEEEPEQNSQETTE